MTINDAGQEVVGGIPTTNLTINDITEHYGVILWSNTEGDVATWDGESNVIHVFSYVGSGIYTYGSSIEDEFADRGLAYVIEYTEFNL